MNAVVNHCASDAVMPSDSMSVGIATPMSVSLRMTTKADPSSSPMMSFMAAGKLN